MAWIGRTSEDSDVELNLSIKEATTLHTILRHVSGAGSVKRTVQDILESFDEADVDYDPDIKPVIGKDDLRFKD